MVATQDKRTATTGTLLGPAAAVKSAAGGAPAPTLAQPTPAPLQTTITSATSSTSAELDKLIDAKFGQLAERLLHELGRSQQQAAQFFAALDDILLEPLGPPPAPHAVSAAGGRLHRRPRSAATTTNASKQISLNRDSSKASNSSSAAPGPAASKSRPSDQQNPQHHHHQHNHQQQQHQYHDQPSSLPADLMRVQHHRSTGGQLISASGRHATPAKPSRALDAHKRLSGNRSAAIAMAAAHAAVASKQMPQPAPVHNYEDDDDDDDDGADFDIDDEDDFAIHEDDQDDTQNDGDDDELNDDDDDEPEHDNDSEYDSIENTLTHSTINNTISSSTNNNSGSNIKRFERARAPPNSRHFPQQVDTTKQVAPSVSARDSSNSNNTSPNIGHIPCAKSKTLTDNTNIGSTTTPTQTNATNDPANRHLSDTNNNNKAGKSQVPILKSTIVSNEAEFVHKQRQRFNPIVRSHTISNADRVVSRFKDASRDGSSPYTSTPSKQQHDLQQQQPRSMVLQAEAIRSLYLPHMNYSTSALGNHRLSDDDEIIIIPTQSPSLLGTSPDCCADGHHDELTERFSISRTKSFWEKLSKGNANARRISAGDALSAAPVGSQDYDDTNGVPGGSNSIPSKGQRIHNQQQHNNSQLNQNKSDGVNFNGNRQHVIDHLGTSGGNNSNYGCVSWNSVS